MGSKVSAPKPTAEERALQAAQKDMIDLQRDILLQQQQQNKILLPFLADQEGFEITQDSNGNILSIKKKDDPLAAQAKEIQGLLQERSLKALKGELPVDPGLERDLTAQKEQLQNKLAQQFGPGYSTASPAIEALQRYDEGANILREGARTGQLTLAEQLGITREQENTFQRQSSQDVLRQSAIGDPLTFAGGFGQTANNYLRAQQPFIENRKMQLQASVTNAQTSASMFGAGIGLVGALFSDADMKGNLIKIAKHTRLEVPIYLYTRKDTGEEMIGVLAQDIQKVRPWAVGEKDGYLVVDYRELN
jgi:hypothetical protein